MNDTLSRREFCIGSVLGLGIAGLPRWVHASESLGVAQIIEAAKKNQVPFTYQINSKGEAEIWDYIGTDSELVVPSSIDGCPVTFITIGNEEHRRPIESIELPDTLRTIGEYAFYGAAMRKIIVPDSVTCIQTGAFACCDNLEFMEIGCGVRSLPEYVAAYCPILSSVNLHNGVQEIAHLAFYNDGNLSNIFIPSTVQWIADNTFQNCNFSLLQIWGNPGSYAESYALSYGLEFHAVDPIYPTSLTSPTAELVILLRKNRMVDETYPCVVGEPRNYNQPIQWKSSDVDVVRVDSLTGAISGVALGEAVVKGVCGDAAVAIPVKVVQGVDSIFLNQNQVDLGTNGICEFQLVAEVYPQDAYDTSILWTSDNCDVVNVDATGLLTLVGPGEAVVTALAADGSGVLQKCHVTGAGAFLRSTAVEDLQSSHPYEDDRIVSWVYEDSGASALAVTFDEQTEVEDGFDFVSILSGDGAVIGTYTGTELAGQTIQIEGTMFTIELTADESSNAWGFAVTEVRAL